MIRPYSLDGLEQKRDSDESKRPTYYTKRRQEFLRLIKILTRIQSFVCIYLYMILRPHRLWSGEPLGIFTKQDVKGLFYVMKRKKKKRQQTI